MGFSRQESWSGVPFPCPGDLPNPGIEPGSPAGRLLTGWAMREVFCCLLHFAQIQIRVFWGPEVERRSPGKIYNSVWYKSYLGFTNRNEINEAYWVASRRSVWNKEFGDLGSLWLNCAHLSISLSLLFLFSKIQEFPFLIHRLPLPVLRVIQRVMHKTVFESWIVQLMSRNYQHEGKKPDSFSLIPVSLCQF